MKKIRERINIGLVLLVIFIGLFSNGISVFAQETEMQPEKNNEVIEESVSDSEIVQQMQNGYINSIKETIDIDINEIILLVVGAGIGIVASVATILVQKWIDMRGKLHIFYRFTYQKGMGKNGWGFGEGETGNLFFAIPVVFELQNTSNTTRVIRDLSLLLYNGEKCISKMMQMDYMKTTRRTGNNVTEEKEHWFGTEKGSYSFVLEPRSIQRQVCEYMLVIPKAEKEKYVFDKIMARYYDEKNKAIYFEVRKVNNVWEQKFYDIDEEWNLLK